MYTGLDAVGVDQQVFLSYESSLLLSSLCLEVDPLNTARESGGVL